MLTFFFQLSYQYFFFCLEPTMIKNCICTLICLSFSSESQETSTSRSLKFVTDQLHSCCGDRIRIQLACGSRPDYKRQSLLAKKFKNFRSLGRLEASSEVGKFFIKDSKKVPTVPIRYGNHLEFLFITGVRSEFGMPGSRVNGSETLV
jgi:hypothetical protein